MEKDYERNSPGLNQMPVSEIATLDFVNNPDRQGTGGLNRNSNMFEAMLSHTKEQESTELYTCYDEAWMKANLKDDFQPKLAILQLREGEENHNRHFASLKMLDRVMHEQPNCENYELVYVRNAEEKTETEQEQEKLNNLLYAEFNADTLRPSNYYGHSLSVSDVIVVANDFNEQYAYFVDDMGFEKLPDGFLSHEMSARIRNDLDIRQEGVLFERIGQFETKNALSIMGEKEKERYFQITTEYSGIFELADRRAAIMDMDALGYEPAMIDGFSDDFLMWKAKDEAGMENSFGLDGWEMVREFVCNVHALMNNYTVKELLDRANGDYSVIEYDTFDDREIQAAINNCPQPEREKITLHIKYAEPINFNGFKVENDTIVFDTLESVEAYANGEVAYDTLDNSVRKGNNEILLYAENGHGEVVWGAKDEQFTQSECSLKELKTQYRNTNRRTR